MTDGTKKILISLLMVSITAVVIFTLPFFQTRTIYVYSSKNLNKEEQNYLEQLDRMGYKISNKTQKNTDISLCFGSSECIKQIEQVQTLYNFIYTDEYFPINIEEGIVYPVILTPHRAIFEHYMRSNIKTALLDIKNPNESAEKFIKILEWMKNN